MKSIWIIGTGQMARDYALVLTKMGRSYKVIGRGTERCSDFQKATGTLPISGGISKFLDQKPDLPGYVINAVGIESLADTTADLLRYGVKRILLEKPGIGYPYEMNDLLPLAIQNNATVLLAYNRRFYASVKKAKEIIQQDGGVTSFHFEFTEWSHTIRTLEKTDAERHNWFLGNSSHLIDLAFYLGGQPISLSSYVKGSLDWHPASSMFTGAGETNLGALFSYHANWEGPGRWGLEVLTRKHRLIFRPIETLQIQHIGSVAIATVEIDDSLDKNFKPGLYLQTEAFLSGIDDEFCHLKDQEQNLNNFYLKMSNYTKEVPAKASLSH